MGETRARSASQRNVLLVRFNERGKPVVVEEDHEEARGRSAGKRNDSTGKRRKNVVEPLWGAAKPPAESVFDPNCMRIPWLATRRPRMGDKNVIETVSTYSSSLCAICIESYDEF